MFRALSFKKKIWSIPIAALSVFCMSLLLTFTVSTRTAKTIADLGTVRYPGMDLAQRLERKVKSIVEGLQTAVAEGDSDKLSELNTLAGQFRDDAEALSKLPEEREAAIELTSLFDRYFGSAMNASKMMLSGKAGEAAAAIAEMRARQQALDKAVQSEAQAAQAKFKAGLEAGSTGVNQIVWATVGGALVVIVALVLLSRFIVESLWRQLGGDPAKARDFAEKIAVGDLSAQVHLDTHDSRSLMAALRAMAGRINTVITAQTEMSREHEQGNIEHRVDADALPGVYRDLARMSNELVEGHLKVTAQLVSVLQDYGHGNFEVDMPQLPGKKGDLTRAAAEAKKNLLAINMELKRLVDAATSGDFGARGNAESFQNMYSEMVGGMNQVMAACETGINGAGGVLESLARGDLRTGMRGEHHGQFAQLQVDANSTVAKLTEIISQIKGATGAIDSAAREISDGNTDLSTRTESQAANLQETASSMEEITAAVKQNAQNANRANELAIGASNVAIKGGEVVAQVVDTMNSIETSSKKIVDIISVIDGIAFQTNILALNAAVEAARAGEQGRGFAVVASEVRNLAQRTATAAKEIKGLIGESVEKVGAGTVLVDTAGRTMNEIVDAVKRVNDIMGEITTASADQSAGIETVNASIAKMDEATQQNAALVQQAAAAAKSLQEQADSLSQAVSIFALTESMTSATVVLARPTLPSGVERGGPKRAKRLVRLSAQARSATAVASAATANDEWEQF